MPKTYPPHPFADIFPLRGGDALIDLSDSIKTRGLRVDIVLHEGQILDGRRRQAGCIRAGVEPRYRDWGTLEGDGDDPLEWLLDVNYHTRNDLSKAELDQILTAFADLKKSNRKKRTPKQVGENGPAIAASLAALIRKAALITTDKAPMRDLACDGLRHAVAILEQL